MSTLLISSGVNDAYLSYLDSAAAYLAGTGAQSQAFQFGNNSYNTRFRIMKGTIGDVSTLLYADRASDILVDINIASANSGGNAAYVTYTPGSNTLTIDTGGTLLTPTASGTPTWFWISVLQGVSTTCQQMVGTISTSGGGGDLILDTPSIDTNVSYFLRNFFITLPTSYEV